MKIFIEKEFTFHTYLHDIIKLIPNEIGNFNFILGHIEINGWSNIIEKWKSNKEWIDYIIPGEEISQISKEVQFIWWVLSLIKKDFIIDKITISKEFFIDWNWNIHNTNIETFWIKEAEIEIIAFDGSETIIQTKNEEIFNYIKDQLIKIND